MMKRSKTIVDRQQEAIGEKSKLLQNTEEIEGLKLSPLFYPKKIITQFTDVSIFYGKKQVADKINFQIERGDRIALCGKNGCGKSSVLKLIAGEQIFHTGKIETGSGIIISYIPQDTSILKGDLRSFAQEEGIEQSLFKTILRKLDFSREQFEKDISQYSEGQKKKVLLARSLCQSAHLYIWDEPLNYIDIFSRVQIEEVLLRFSPTMIFVEHDSAFADKIATKKIQMKQI